MQGPHHRILVPSARRNLGCSLSPQIYCRVRHTLVSGLHVLCDTSVGMSRGSTTKFGTPVTNYSQKIRQYRLTVTWQRAKLERPRKSDFDKQHGSSANTSAPFLTCPNCQIGDTDTIWSLFIGSGSEFRVNVVIWGSDLAIGAPAT